MACNHAVVYFVLEELLLPPSGLMKLDEANKFIISVAMRHV
jgi:hypothetical protein